MTRGNEPVSEPGAYSKQIIARNSKYEANNEMREDRSTRCLHSLVRLFVTDAVGLLRFTVDCSPRCHIYTRWGHHRSLLHTLFWHTPLLDDSGHYDL